MVGNNPVNWIDPLGLAPVYSCKRPLGGKPGENYPPVLYHQYNCVTLPDGSEQCDSNNPGPYWPILTRGRPSDPNKDYHHPKACEKVSDDKNDCIRDCLIGVWQQPRPVWDVGPNLLFTGVTDCQEYSDDTLAFCMKKCAK
jgi:hypothetical protein